MSEPTPDAEAVAALAEVWQRTGMLRPTQTEFAAALTAAGWTLTRTPAPAEAVEQHGHWYDGVPGVWASDVAPDGFCDQCRPQPAEAAAALDRALDGAMATAGLSVMPSHYSRHVLTRLSEQGFALTRDHARCEALREALETLVNAWDCGVNPDPSQWKRLDRDIDEALAKARAALSDDAP